MLSRSPVGVLENTINEEIKNITISIVNKDRFAKIREDTNNDAITTKLAEIIMKRWPSTNRDLDKDIIPYYSYKVDLVMNDGIIFKGQRIVIPDIIIIIII